jgi:hypothetical protein
MGNSSYATFASERGNRALQTVGRLMTAVELLLNASRAEGFDGATARAEELHGVAVHLLEIARGISASGETKK